MTSHVTRQWEIAEEVRAMLENSDVVRGLWVGGSLARNDADRLSDVDLLLLVEGEAPSEFADGLERLIGEAFEPVLVRRRGDAEFQLLNVVMRGWERLDFGVYNASSITKVKLSAAVELFCRDCSGADGLSLQASPQGAEARDVEWTLSEFVRILGLLPVVLYRCDLVGAVTGSAALRQLLVTLLRFQSSDVPVRGALNQQARLTTEDAELILSLPSLAADRQRIVHFNHACWLIYLASGPSIAARHNLRWPAELVSAVSSHLQRELGEVVWPVSEDGSGCAG